MFFSRFSYFLLIVNARGNIKDVVIVVVVVWVRATLCREPKKHFVQLPETNILAATFDL